MCIYSIYHNICKYEKSSQRARDDVHAASPESIVGQIARACSSALFGVCRAESGCHRRRRQRVSVCHRTSDQPIKVNGAQLVQPPRERENRTILPAVCATATHRIASALWCVEHKSYIYQFATKSPTTAGGAPKRTPGFRCLCVVRSTFKAKRTALLAFRNFPIAHTTI